MSTSTLVPLQGGGFSQGVVAVLPAAVGTDPLNPPSMACYTSTDPAAGAWFAVSYSLTSTPSVPYCFLQFSATSNVWRAVMLQMQVGQTAAFVIVY